MTYYVSYVPKLANENMRFLKEVCDTITLKLVVSRKYIWQGVIFPPLPPSPQNQTSWASIASHEPQ
jgi:hypothetical protein